MLAWLHHAPLKSLKSGIIIKFLVFISNSFLKLIKLEIK